MDEGVQDPADKARDAGYWDAVEEATELLQEDRPRDALVALREVLRVEPQNHYAFYYLGVALYESGEIEAARDAYQACLKLAPKHLGAKVALTHVLRALGDLKGALKEGLSALQQAPGDGDVLHAIGLVYVARGERAAAQKYLEAFLDTGPELEVALEVREILAGLGLGVVPRITDE